MQTKDAGLQGQEGRLRGVLCFGNIIPGNVGNRGFNCIASWTPLLEEEPLSREQL